jgi:single-strand DNA-binding protein
MSSYNRVVLMGNLTRDPEVKQVSAGNSLALFGLAMNETYRNPAGERVEKTCFVDVVAWGRQAEACEAFLKKGQAVLVEGRLQLDEWEGDKGEKRSKLKVKADAVRFIGGGGERGNGRKAGAGRARGGERERSTATEEDPF